MKKQLLLAAFILSGITAVLTSCKDDDKDADPTPAPAATLYERVGGTTMVADPNNPAQMIEKGRLTLRAVVDSSIFVIAADTQLQKYFPVLFAELDMNNTTGLAALSKSLTDFLCSATGAKNTAYAYTGKNMKDAHDPAKNNRMGLKANAADFDKFVGDIGIGLAQNGVTSANSKALVDDLVALLYTTKTDIVQR